MHSYCLGYMHEHELDQERQLIEQAKENKALFSHIYERHITAIYQYFYYRVSDRDLAEDLTSQTFLQAYEHFDRFEWQGVSFRAWLYRIGHNLLVSHYRNQKRSISLDEMIDVPKVEASFVHEIDITMQFEHMQAFLQELPFEVQQIILWRIYENIPFRTISEMLEKSEPACKMAYLRGLEKIRQCYFAEYPAL